MSALDKAQFEFAQELLYETIDKIIQTIKEAKTDEQKIISIIRTLVTMNAGKKAEVEIFSGYYTALTELFEFTKKLSGRMAELEERLE